MTHEFLTLRKAIARYALSLFAVFAALLLVPMEGDSLATQIFLSAKDSLIPAGIPVVAMGPVSSFVAPVVMAFLAAFLATFPIGLFLALGFLSPALRRRERQALRSYVLPALILFYAGCALAYLIIIPSTFRILYSFAEPIGVAPLFALDDFISSVFFLTISVGVAFLLPVAMAALSRAGIVPGGFWLRHWRGAVIAAVLASAIITPDGSGVTMAFLSVPIIGLYAAGAAIAGRNRKT